MVSTYLKFPVIYLHLTCERKLNKGSCGLKKNAAVNFTAYLPNFDMKTILTHLNGKLMLGNLNIKSLLVKQKKYFYQNEKIGRSSKVRF